jgi:hypothetical protein
MIGTARESDGNNSQAEHRSCSVPRQRAQRFGGLRGRIDVGLSGLVQRRAGRQDDEIHDEVGEGHAAQDIVSGLTQFVVQYGGPLSIPEAAGGDHLLDLDVGLPGVEIGR